MDGRLGPDLLLRAGVAIAIGNAVVVLHAALVDDGRAVDGGLDGPGDDQVSEAVRRIERQSDDQWLTKA